jgi:hypothetical protein
MWALQHTDTADQDIVGMSARINRFGSGSLDLHQEQIFSDYEQTLFTRAVSVAEKAGKKISLLVVPARDPWSAIVQTANAMESAAVVIGLSSRMASQEQAFHLGRAWESAPEPKRQFVLQVVRPDLSVDTFRIGPHAPTMKPEDVQLVHRLWLNITKEVAMERIHHSDVVTLALTRFARDYAGRDRADILRELRRDGGRHGTALPAPPEPPTLTAEPPSPGSDDDKHKRPPTSKRPF